MDYYMDLHARNSVFRTIVKRFEKGIVSHIGMMRYSETSLYGHPVWGPPLHNRHFTQE